MTGFWICPADANGDRIVGAEVRLNPGPVEVDYPQQQPGSKVETDAGRVIRQQSAADPRPRAWIWRELPAGTPGRRYDRVIAEVETLLSRTRRQQGFSPFVYLRDDETDILGRWVSSHGVATGTGVDTLTDSGKSWVANEYKNGVVEVFAGGGAGLRRSVASNTATALSLSDEWGDTVPSSANYVVTGWRNDWVRARVVHVSKQPHQGGPAGVSEDQLRFEFVIEEQDALVAHYVADVGATLLSGSELGTLEDQAGYGSDLAATTLVSMALRGPTWTAAAVNGYAIVSHAGTVRNLQAKPVGRPVVRDFGMLAVARLDLGGANHAWLWSQSEWGVQFGLGSVYDAASGDDKIGGYLQGVGWLDCDAAWTASEWAVVGVLWADGILRFFRNGAFVGRYPDTGVVPRTAPTTASTNVFSVDGATAGTGSAGRFSWAEWCLFDGAMSTVRLQRRARALCDKYGITPA